VHVFGDDEHRPSGRRVLDRVDYRLHDSEAATACICFHAVDAVEWSIEAAGNREQELTGAILLEFVGAAFEDKRASRSGTYSRLADEPRLPDARFTFEHEDPAAPMNRTGDQPVKRS
jgi:hypothetical protein